jgi:hypothetical protein
MNSQTPSLGYHAISVIGELCERCSLKSKCDMLTLPLIKLHTLVRLQSLNERTRKRPRQSSQLY